jgi:hypothetical protein
MDDYDDDDLYDEPPTPEPTPQQAPAAPTASLIMEEEEIPFTEDFNDSHIIDMPERKDATILPKEVRKESDRHKKKKKKKNKND